MKTKNTHVLKATRWIQWSILIALLCAPLQAWTNEPWVAVLYPETGEPYRTVFEQVAQGVESRVAMRRYALRATTDVAELQQALDVGKPVAIIALGQRGMKTARALSTRVPKIVGAVLAPPGEVADGMSGISLTPDPELLFARLHGLVPRIRRVVVVYSEAQNGWLITLAKTAAETHGLELVARRADDLPAAAQVYREVLGSNRDDQTAVWLPMDTLALDEVTLVPMILERAWNGRMVIFSSSLVHVSKGALFALYPDNQKMGRHLADMALKSTNSTTAVFLPLRDTRFAINVRSASHLGIEVDPMKLGVDLVFPAR